MSPATSKYAGQGLYSFVPRKAKYIHFVFKQTEPYVIETPAGDRLRYAIGLRDIDVRGFTFLSEGEIISLPFETIDEVRKVALNTNQNPAQLSELGSIQYFVSPDNGATYHEIQPQELQGTEGILDVPEILEFNGPSSNSINTSVPVQSLRIKTRFTRNDDVFNDNTTALAKTVLTKSEVHTVPQAAPFQIELQESPVDNSIIVIDPLFGSRGIKDSPYIINRAEDHINSQLYRLPFKTWPRPIQKVLSGNKWHTEPLTASNWIHVEVGGEEWSHITDQFSTYTADDKVYSLDINRGELKFGNNTNGRKPDVDQPIHLYMDAERLFPTANENNHLAKLDFSASANKDDFHILRYDEPEVTTEIVPKQATVIRLENENITNLGTIPSIFGAGSQKTFINGKDELITTGDWSIDTEKGIIYLREPSSDIDDQIITYTHQPIYTLSSNEWSWATTNLLRDSISIKEDAWQTRIVDDLELIQAGYGFTGVKVLGLPNLSIVRNSLKIQLTGTVSGGGQLSDNLDKHPLLKEVEFIDGKTELGNEISKTIESVPSLTTTPISTFTVAKPISPSSNHPVTFSNTSIFATDVSPATPSSIGEYKVDKSTGTIEVYIGTTTYQSKETGTINYFALSPTFSTNGLYSVDYKTGTMYLQRPIDPDNQDDWVLTISYEFTEFRAEYRIARLLSGETYDVDITNGIIELKDSEVMKHTQIPKQTSSIREPYYIVNYEYISEALEDAAALVNYYTPVLKDYALKIITKGQLF